MRTPNLAAMAAALLLACAACLMPATAHAQAADPAETAWVAGDYDTAERLYAARLAQDPNDIVALHRVALIRAWGGRHDESVALFDRLLRLQPDNRAAMLERARTLAWARRYDEAIQAVDALLALEPTNRAYLEARAQFTSWAGRHDEALHAYGRLIEVTPGDPALQLARARVLGWARQYDDAIVAYRQLLQASPGDRELTLGLAQVLSWSGRTAEATALFGEMLQRDPGDMDALRGLARAASWSGELRLGERRWRDVLAREPNDVEALVGLGANLRWQGRDAAALQALTRAQELEPGNPDVAVQLQHLRAGMAPRVSPTWTWEEDSDNNRMQTFAASAAVRIVPRAELRFNGYFRDLRGPDFIGATRDNTSYGGSAGVWLQFDPGWAITAMAGVTAIDHATVMVPPASSTAGTLASTSNQSTVMTARASLASPVGLPAAGSLTFARSAFDFTALLADNVVTTEQVALDGRVRLSPRWQVSGTASTTVFDGTERNRQLAGTLGTTYRLWQPVTVGLAGRAFTFEKDRTELLDGYFNPDFHGIVEAPVSLYREVRRWVLSAEAAPGVQQIGSDGDASASLRAGARVAYAFRPGRQVGVSAAFANSGLQQLTPDGADYRYRAVGFFGGWSF